MYTRTEEWSEFVLAVKSIIYIYIYIPNASLQIGLDLEERNSKKKKSRKIINHIANQLSTCYVLPGRFSKSNF